MVDTTSKYLADQIDFWDEELGAEELSEYTAHREALLKSVEGLYEKNEPTMFTILSDLRRTARKLPTELVRQFHDRVAWSLDDSLSRIMVSEIPRMVSRALQLEPLLLKQSTQADENPHIREATRCYLFGLFNASVALSRAALEQALDRKIPALLRGESREERLMTLIKTVRASLLKHAPQICDLADKVRKRA
ncbi:MAG: hypothetical protein AAB037_04295, partial [Chloroflexota bacterium]